MPCPTLLPEDSVRPSHLLDEERTDKNKTTHSDIVKKSISSVVEALFQYVNSASKISICLVRITTYIICVKDNHL